MVADGPQDLREEALQRLSSPEETDRLSRVTDTRLGRAGGHLRAIILGLIWSYVGRIPSFISGRGVIVRKGGVLKSRLRDPVSSSTSESR